MLLSNGRYRESGRFTGTSERGAETSVEAFLNHQGVHSSDVKQVQYKESFRHTFSHFHLDIEPIYIELKKVPTMVVKRAPNDGCNLLALPKAKKPLGFPRRH